MFSLGPIHFTNVLCFHWVPYILLMFCVFMGHTHFINVLWGFLSHTCAANVLFCHIHFSNVLSFHWFTLFFHFPSKAQSPDGLVVLRTNSSLIFNSEQEVISKHYITPYALNILFDFLEALNSLMPDDAYMHHWNGSPLVQIMACCLLGAKPLSEPMLEYC